VAARRRKVGIGLFVLLLVVVGLLVAVDRVGAAAAENLIADQAAKEMTARHISTARRPDVSVGGFPFLTQVLSGDYESIKIVLRDVEGGGVRLPELDIKATGVHADLDTIRSGEGQARADRVVGTATVGYPTIAALANLPGLQLSGQDGRLRVRLPVEIQGQDLVLIGTAKVQVNDDVIRVRVSELDEENGKLPAAARSIADSYADQLSVNLKLPDLPYDLTVNEVTPESSGLAVTATARAVPITS
jgi:LmeA-like phospholipid-binding